MGYITLADPDFLLQGGAHWYFPHKTVWKIKNYRPYEALDPPLHRLHIVQAKYSERSLKIGVNNIVVLKLSKAPTEEFFLAQLTKISYKMKWLFRAMSQLWFKTFTFMRQTVLYVKSSQSLNMPWHTLSLMYFVDYFIVYLLLLCCCLLLSVFDKLLYLQS